MEQPEVFVTKGEGYKLCKLQKLIYGLKQAARAWNKGTEGTFLKLELKQSLADQCLFTKHESMKVKVPFI